MVKIREKIRDNLYLGIVILLILYAILLVSPSLIIFLLLPGISIIDFFFLNTILSFVFQAILWFLIVPFGLHLPNGKESFRGYNKTIHLSTIQPLRRNILLGLICAGTYCLCKFCGALLFGTFVFDLNVLFTSPDADNGVLGWLIFLITVNPGIWEEITFRGVILTLLLKKISQKKAIILDGIIFGLLHLINLISLIRGNSDQALLFILITLIQVVYTSFGGIFFAYMCTKTESLLPCIITHYLLDSITMLFNAVIIDPALDAIYTIIFIGLAPMIINIFIIKFITQRE
ncbi:MAG: lysostaphin resistance A-like protein [Promethearchaeota archaeon]